MNSHIIAIKKTINTMWEYAINNGIIRLELEVFKSNNVAISFYQKTDFEEEGIKNNAFF